MIELAISSVREIIKEYGGKASWTQINDRWIPAVSKYGDIYIVDLLDRALESFPHDSSGSYSIPKTLVPLKNPSEIASEIKTTIDSSKKSGATFQAPMLPVIRFAQAMKDKMKLADEYLSPWRSSVKEVISDLSTIGADSNAFLSKRGNSAPAEFEFTVAKSFSVIFQSPLYVEYGAVGRMRPGSSVLWRGQIENYAPVNHAKGGGADILVYARGPYQLLAEVTLRYSSKQWKEEIEPIFRHAEDFINENRLSKEDVYMVFVVPKDVLSKTYEWLHLKAGGIQTAIFDVRSLAKLTVAVDYVWGLPHVEIRRLLETLSNRVAEDDEVSTYNKDLGRELDGWIRDALTPHLSTYIAVQAYAYLKKRNGYAKVNELAHDFENNTNIENYLSLTGRSLDYVRRNKQDWIHQLSLLGLARSVADTLLALPSEEFENKYLKTYGFVTKLWQPSY